MFRTSSIAVKAALTVLLVCGAMGAAAAAADLSKYRGFQFGTDLPTVAKEAGVNATQAKAVSSRPALIQELDWRPRNLGPSAQTESASEVVFSFYNGELYRIAITYDRYETEGLTADDLVDAVSSIYGSAARNAAARFPEGRDADEDEVVASWQDLQYGFDLVRSSYGPTFKLVGVLKKLDGPAQAAILEARRLDDQEAPQRDAARLAGEQELAKAKLEKSRLLNKPRFRP